MLSALLVALVAASQLDGVLSLMASMEFQASRKANQ